MLFCPEFLFLFTGKVSVVLIKKHKNQNKNNDKQNTPKANNKKQLPQKKNYKKKNRK